MWRSVLDHLAACSSACFCVFECWFYDNILQDKYKNRTYFACFASRSDKRKQGYILVCLLLFIYNKHSSIRWMPLLVMAFRLSAVTSLLCSEHLKWQFIIWSFLLHLNEQFLCKYSGYCLRWETDRTENQGLMSFGPKKKPPPPKSSWLLLDKYQTIVFIARKVASA